MSTPSKSSSDKAKPIPTGTAGDLDDMDAIALLTQDHRNVNGRPGSQRATALGARTTSITAD
jgi:hypothetical protein